MDQGMSFAEALEHASDVGTDVRPMLEEMLVAVYRRQQEHGWTQGIVEHIERVVMETGSLVRPDRTSVFAFVDLAGYTQATDERGDRAGAQLAREMAGLVDRTTAEHGGTPVKWLGDGVMVLSRTRRRRCARRCRSSRERRRSGCRRTRASPPARS